VNGRQGALEEIFISATQIPPDYEFVDPVGLLPDEDTDLLPEETWLNITYATPDGGEIEAWVRADFVDVRDAAGEQVRLRDLPTVAGNRPGESRNTSITSPQAQEDVVTVRVTNLDPTANLNVRRTPDTTGEVLAQLPLNTVAEFLGIAESGEWIFLRYSAPEGVVTTGWASAGFLEIGLNGESADLERLEAEGLLTTADETQRGSQTIGAAPVVVPTLDPTIDAVIAEVALDPGANLNLRRAPDQTAEVLAQIPSGTRVIVTERSPDAQWLSVTYEGVEGWIAAQTSSAVFVRLSFNGGPFAIEDVPVTAQFAPESTAEAG
jgi:SH3-like domain-containing protein